MFDLSPVNHNKGAQGKKEDRIKQIIKEFKLMKLRSKKKNKIPIRNPGVNFTFKPNKANKNKSSSTNRINVEINQNFNNDK